MSRGAGKASRDPAGASGYLGTSYNPFMIEGNGGKNANGGFTGRVRGITLPTGFTLEELDKRETLLQGFDHALSELDKSADIVDGLDTFHRRE